MEGTDILSLPFARALSVVITVLRRSMDQKAWANFESELKARGKGRATREAMTTGWGTTDDAQRGMEAMMSMPGVFGVPTELPD